MKRWKALIAVLAAALLTAAPAQAEDAFYFQDQTGIGFTGTMSPPEPECFFGQTGLFISSPNPSSTGSLRSEMDFFSECPVEFWDPFLAYNQRQTASYTQEGFTKYLFDSGVGALDFLAEDPRIGSATLHCGSLGEEWEEANGYEPIEPYMTAEVDGTTCTVSWVPGMRAAGEKAGIAKPPGTRVVTGRGRAGASAAETPRAATHLRFVDSLARVERGSAQVEVQAFGPPGRVARGGVTLRSGSGAVIGRGAGLLRAGARPRLIAVPLSATARHTLAGKRAELRVQAALGHADASAGSGDATQRLILR